MIEGINHINFAVSDLEKSFDFYRDVLGFTPIVKWHEGAYFLAGQDWICLYLDPKREATPSPCYTHVAFSVTQEDFEALSQRIQNAGTILWKDNLSEGNSLYFLDPSGHKLEIHVGDWKSRSFFKKENPSTWQTVEWFMTKDHMETLAASFEPSRNYSEKNEWE